MDFNVTESLSQRVFRKCLRVTANTAMRLLEEGVIGVSLMIEGAWQPYAVYTVAKPIMMLCIHVTYSNIMCSRMNYPMRSVRLLSSELGLHTS